MMQVSIRAFVGNLASSLIILGCKPIILSSLLRCLFLEGRFGTGSTISARKVRLKMETRTKIIVSRFSSAKLLFEILDLSRLFLRGSRSPRLFCCLFCTSGNIAVRTSRCVRVTVNDAPLALVLRILLECG